MQVASSSPSSRDESDAAEWAARLAAAEKKLAEANAEIARLRQAYTRALEQLKLLQRRLFVAKAERANAVDAQLAFDSMFAHASSLAKVLGEPLPPLDDKSDSDKGDEEPLKGKSKKKSASTGRRSMSELDLPVVEVTLDEPPHEGTFERIGVEDSWYLGHERGGARRIHVRRVVYKVTTNSPPTHDPTTGTEVLEIVASEAPRHLVRRPMLAPSMIAHILASKYLLGVPFYRLEQQFSLQGVPLDRGTMSRYAEDVGATLGAIVLSMRDEAFRTAFCLSTDATGICIQPGPIADRPKKERGPCHKGHFFVVLADRDHVFFEYQAKHTSQAVCSMFQGFTGYIQADAHTVYDALFSGRAPRSSQDPPPTGPPPTEVGCWSHLRTDFWEAAVCKHAIGVEGLRRINIFFEAERLLKDLSPAQRKQRRNDVVRPLVDAFFEWVKSEHARPRERGLAASALGYAIRQEAPLRRFLDDGRLVMTNNGSERALRAIAAARKLWMFFGSDDHASAAANLFSLVASCKLHGLDPEAYLADVIRVMPYWPRERYLELSPKYWRTTRTQLDGVEMARALGRISVPAPDTTEQKEAPR